VERSHQAIMKGAKYLVTLEGFLMI
jgi:hypothetical protein